MNLRSGRSLLCLSSLLAVLLSGALSAAPLQLLAEDAAGRWGMPDGTGAGNDIVLAAFQAAGLEVTFEVMPYKRAKLLTLQGLALGCFGMSWEPALEGHIVFPRNELYTNTATLLFQTADAERYAKTGTLPSGRKIGTVLGYEYPPEVAAFIAANGLTVEEAGSEVQNLKKLAAGRIDLMVANLDDLKSAAELSRDAGVVGLVAEGARLAVSKTYVGFSTDHPDTPRALAAFDRGMDVIKGNGVLARILARWRQEP